MAGARPGELSQCTVDEFDNGNDYEEQFLINVKGHKTGAHQQAVVSIDKKDLEMYRTFRAVLNKLPQLPNQCMSELKNKTRGFNGIVFDMLQVVRANTIYRHTM